MNATLQPQVLQKRSKIRVYFLAAPEEEDECLAIRKHLSPAIRNSKIPIEINSDYDIAAGEDKAKYKLKLLEADIVLALISSDYISDDETYERTQKVITRYNNNETILVPILVRNCLWKSTPFVNLPLLPKNFQPLNNKQYWNSEDDALMAVVEDIYEAINDFSNKVSVETAPAPIEIIKVVEEELKTDSAATKRIKLAEEPELQINGVEIGFDLESQFKEIKTEIQSEKIIVKTEQPVTDETEPVHRTEPKKQKTITPLEVDWRKQYYKKVLWKRALAFFLDHLVMIPVSIGVMILYIFVEAIMNEIMNIQANPENTDVTDGKLLLYLFIGFLAYLLINAKMESSKWRGTLGKRILKLQITDKAGEPVSFFRALVRNILRPIFGYLYISFITLIIQYFRFKKTKKLFHDELSGTVIGERLSR